jgi:short-subunit dehydrogenase
MNGVGYGEGVPTSVPLQTECSRALLHGMLDRKRGGILNVASTTGHQRGLPGELFLGGKNVLH